MSPTQVHDSPAAAGAWTALPQQIVLLGAGGQRFGVPIGVLREIIPPRPFTPLPGSAASVCGLINLRGRIVTAIDLGARLGLASCLAGADYKIVIVDHGTTLAGLVVDEVAGITHAKTLRTIGPEVSYVNGIGSGPEGDYAVIDPAELLRTVLR